MAYEPSRVQQYGKAILEQGKQLTNMVEQILAFAGEQFRKNHNQLEALDLGPVVNQAIATVAPAARDAGVEIEAYIPPGLPPVLADVQAIQQALVNLLINASKYAATGGWIGVSIQHGTGGELEIRVEDKGPGIPAGERRHIFEPFYRGSAAARANSHGAGLGLTIVDRIAQAHSGRVTVASDPGRGTCFTLHLPTI